MGIKNLQKSFLFFLALSSSLLLLLSSAHAIRGPNQLNHTSAPNRQALEIIIGGGGIGIGGNPSPPPINCPPPVPPTRVEIATKAILEFKKRIQVDPHCITATWVGRNACEWRGFECAYLKPYNQQALYSVQFNGFGFAGEDLGIDNFIDQLPDISIFHANSNHFKGKIPKLSTLPYLFELDLSNNNYEGGFPEDVLGATNLTYLDLRFNTFCGQVPPQLFNLELVALFINNNNFHQPLPSNIGSTPAAFVTYANNKFTGEIPASISDAKDTLLEILFLKNELTGCLPCEIGQLRKTRVFDVEGNCLTGTIPHSFGCLEKMQYLILARNNFHGVVPEVICKLPNLVNLTLSNNYFTEVGPECRKQIQRKVLDVKMNCVKGLGNQRSEEECKKFLNEPKMACTQKAELYTQIPCRDTAAYLNKEVSINPPIPQPTLSYSALAPASA